MSQDNRRLAAFHRFAATGCTLALEELDAIAAREGIEASITEQSLRDLVSKAHVVILNTRRAENDARSDVAQPYGGNFILDDVIRAITSAMVKFPSQEVWSVSILHEVPVLAYHSRSTIRKALGYLVGGKDCVLKAQGSRPVLYSLREPALTPKGIDKAASYVRDPRMGILRVRTSRIRTRRVYQRYGVGFRFRKSLDKLRTLRAAEIEAARLEIEDDIFYCAAC